MTKNQLVLFGIAFSLTGVAVLLFVAGAPRFDLLPRTYANYGGIAAAVVGAVLWALFGLSFARREEN